MADSNAHDRALFRHGVEYVYSTGYPQQSVEELSQVLTQALPDKREVTVSFAQQLEKRGFEKGMKATHQEVWQASKRETAKKLLANQAELALIKAATGLTDAELAEIAKETEE